MYWPSAASTLLWYKHGTEHGFVYIDWCFILLLLYGVEQWHSWTQQKKTISDDNSNNNDESSKKNHNGNSDNGYDDDGDDESVYLFIYSLIYLPFG